jgi:formate hydrogenlyase subunit 6/NADH:ubiquinone oxidoreductase subunit I
MVWLGDLVAKGGVSIVVERCKACGFCVEFCPAHVLSSAFNPKGNVPDVNRRLKRNQRPKQERVQFI